MLDRDNEDVFVLEGERCIDYGYDNEDLPPRYTDIWLRVININREANEDRINFDNFKLNTLNAKFKILKIWIKFKSCITKLL